MTTHSLHPTPKKNTVKQSLHPSKKQAPLSPRTPSAPRHQPDYILELQRTIGNRATLDLMRKNQQETSAHQIKQPVMIQRRFVGGEKFLDSTDGTDWDFVEMADLVDDYNAYLDRKIKDSSDYVSAARILKTLDTKIFNWVSENNKTYQKLTDIPHYMAVEALRQQSAKEHEEFVAETTAHSDEGALPFDLSGMDRNEAWNLIVLWNRIKQNTGKIKVTGDPDYQKKVYSWLVKILETPTGRKLLSYLNAGDPGEVMTNVYIGQQKSQLPEGVEEKAKEKGKDIEDFGRSEAQPLGKTGEMIGPTDLTGDENPKEYPTIVDASGFREALLAGKKGVILNGKKYAFNTDSSNHVGAFVTAYEGESKNENEQHNQIMTPGWVTLGHELGHAAHFKGGGTTMMSPDIMQDLTGKSRDELEMTWQNSEELLTINNWENALRTESGISERASHIPYTAGKKVERYWSINADLQATYDDKSYARIPTISDFKRDLKAAFNSKDSTNNLEDDGVFNGLQNRWRILKAQYGPGDLETIKRGVLQPLFDKLFTKYAQKAREYKKKWLVKKTQKREWRKLSAEFNVMKDVYDNSLDAEVAVGPDSQFEVFQSSVDRLQYKIGKMTF